MGMRISRSLPGGTMVLSYSLPRAGHVCLWLFYVNGQRRLVLVNRHQDAGFYEVSLHRGAAPAGPYVAVLKSGGTSIEKMVLLIK
jgi:hypothetical protein